MNETHTHTYKHTKLDGETQRKCESENEVRKIQQKKIKQSK